ncbi:MAG: hypothetical protein ACK527_12275 [Acidobacteriota bacterium]
MRIKVTLDPDVEWLLREAMREKSISFQEALKEAARAGFRKPGQGEARRLAPGLRGLWAFMEHAHNGLASARQVGRVPRPLVPGLRGLCALLEHAHNGLASACALSRNGREIWQIAGYVQSAGNGPLG